MELYIYIPILNLQLNYDKLIVVHMCVYAFVRFEINLTRF
jgi:hypothetical protein